MENYLQSFASSVTVMLPCQICGKQSLNKCSKCERANYCSKQHQIQHWKASHRKTCISLKKLRPEVQVLAKQCQDAKKTFYQNYSNHRTIHSCLLDAKVILGLNRQILQLDNCILNQLQYGASVCLLVKTYLLLQDKTSAKYQMQSYLKIKDQFLNQIQKYTEQKQNSRSNQKVDEYQSQLQMKLNLISGIANLCYAIGMDANKYYVLYTKYIITRHGEDSFQASNCYFLLGCFFAEEGWFQKAIYCFQKSASIRGTQFGGDCFYNIGVLYKLMNNLPKGLQTLEIAIKLRQQQYGEDSNEVAEVNQLMGTIYAQLNDYKTSLAEYQKACKVRVANPLSPQYENLTELIYQLYQKVKLYVQVGQPNMKRPDIYNHLIKQIQNQPLYWQHSKYKPSIKQNDRGDNIQKQAKEQQKFKKKKNQTENTQKFKWKQSGLFNISEQFIAQLNKSELFRLSQLQLELEKCDSVFSLVYTIGTSLFFQSLNPQIKHLFQKQNQKLVELIRTQDVSKIKHNDK